MAEASLLLSACGQCGREPARAVRFCPWCGEPAGEPPLALETIVQVHEQETVPAPQPEIIAAVTVAAAAVRAQAAAPSSAASAAPAAPAPRRRADLVWLGLALGLGLAVGIVLLLPHKREAEPAAETAPPTATSDMSAAAPATQSAPSPEPAQMQSVAPAPAAPDLRTRASARALAYFALWSSPNDVTLASLEDFYGDPIDFYGKVRTRDDVLQEKRAFVERWPERTYSLRDDTLAIGCDAASSQCDVSGVLDWVAVSAPRAARSEGVASFRMILSFEGNDGRIVLESGQVISRQP